MGSYAECWLGTFYVGSTKNDIDINLINLFQSSDKKVLQGKKEHVPFQLHRWTNNVEDDEDIDLVYYQAPVNVIRDRLELQGYTLDLTKEVYKICIEEEILRYQKLANEKFGEAFRDQFLILKSIDIDTWLEALSQIKKEGLEKNQFGQVPKEYDGTLIGYMLSQDWYGYPGPDLKVGLRLAIEVCSENDEFIYDVTDLVLSGYFNAYDDLVRNAMELSSSDFSVIGKIIILTEGRSDSWIIAESMQLLYSHLSDYYSFMDFEGARVGGGAGNLANIIKAFTGAGIVNKVIALFDNDTAAESAIQGLRGVLLPKNIKIQKLPDIPILRTYPTIGPSGLIFLDVNGLAASIELYLGKDVLMDGNGDLPPVQWTGYDSAQRKYQGEVLYKEQIQDRFRQHLFKCKTNSDLIKASDWSGLQAILKSIFISFHDLDSAEILRAVNYYYH